MNVGTINDIQAEIKRLNEKKRWFFKKYQAENKLLELLNEVGEQTGIDFKETIEIYNPNFFKPKIENVLKDIIVTKLLPKFPDKNFALVYDTDIDFYILYNDANFYEYLKSYDKSISYTDSEILFFNDVFDTFEEVTMENNELISYWEWKNFDQNDDSNVIIFLHNP